MLVNLELLQLRSSAILIPLTTWSRFLDAVQPQTTETIESISLRSNFLKYGSSNSLRENRQFDIEKGITCIYSFCTDMLLL